MSAGTSSEVTAIIDWKTLAGRVHALEGGSPSVTAAAGARRAIELLIGEFQLRRAVDQYMLAHDREPAADLIRLVLALIRPPSAMTRCYEIYRSGADAATRCTALYLLRSMADRQAWPWIAEFVADPDADVRACGIEVLYELLVMDQVRPEECEAVVARAEGDGDPGVRRQAAQIRELAAHRQGHQWRESAIATQRRETLIALNDTYYFSVVVTRTFYLRRHRDQLFVQKLSLFDPLPVEEILVRETITEESGALKETRTNGFDLRAYLAFNQARAALWLGRDTSLYWGVDEQGLFAKPSAVSQERAVIVPWSTLRSLFPQASANTRVVEACRESGICFVVLEQGTFAWSTDVFQKLVPVHGTVISRVVASFQRSPTRATLDSDPPDRIS